MRSPADISSTLSRSWSRFRAALAGATNDRLVQNIGWYGLAEAAARVSRLAATVVLARMLDVAELGTAAIAITCFELARVLTSNGIGQWVVRASADRLEAACNTAFRAIVVVNCAAVVVQIGLGALLAVVWGKPEAFAMLACLAGVYVLMIPGLIPVFLLVRQNRIRALAVNSVTQIIADNALTAVLALAGFGAWAIVLPKLLTTPVWLIGALLLQRWRPSSAAGLVPMAELLRYCLPVLASEALSAARLNLDKLIVWGILGVEALGIYYFACNAGIGLSMALTSALATALYPQLAAHAARPAELLKRFQEAAKRIVLPLSAIIALQAAAAFLYVPLVFGQRWQHAVPLVALMCASAVSKPLYDAACQLLRAVAQPRLELAGALLLTVASLSALTVGLQVDLSTGVTTYAGAVFALQAALSSWAISHVAHKHARGPSHGTSLGPRPLTQTGA
ncbi:MAG: oligosaccharide flippase family protein [Hyphomicrobiaceae bacterium]